MRSKRLRPSYSSCLTLFLRQSLSSYFQITPMCRKPRRAQKSDVNFYSQRHGFTCTVSILHGNISAARMENVSAGALDTMSKNNLTRITLRVCNAYMGDYPSSSLEETDSIGDYLLKILNLICVWLLIRFSSR